MNPAAFFIRRPVATVLLVIGIALTGIAACTSRAAESILRFRSNWRLMRVEPLPELDVISLTPAITPNLRSSGVATLVAIVSGLAPGRLALTEIDG